MTETANVGYDLVTEECLICDWVHTQTIYSGVYHISDFPIVPEKIICDECKVKLRKLLGIDI